MKTNFQTKSSLFKKFIAVTILSSFLMVFSFQNVLSQNNQQVELQADSDGRYYYEDSSSGERVYTDYDRTNINTAPAATDSTTNNPGSFEAGAGGSQGFEAGAGGSQGFEFGGVDPNDPSKAGAIPVQTIPIQSEEDVTVKEEAVNCAASTLLANALTSAIYSGIGMLFGSLIGEPLVPTKSPVPESAREGFYLFGVQILPSWDSLGYCLANAIIVKVADDTINWIQNGFEGSPAFVEDPTALFKDIADYEMANFLYNFLDGALCEPFGDFVTISLVNSYTQGYSSYGKCTLDTVGGNIDSFFSGESFSYEQWFAVTQNPANNPYGAYLMAESEARNRISAGIGPIRTELDWGNGYFSWRYADGEKKGKIVSPGSVVQAQLEKTIGLDKDRLVLAEKFDQVIAALVNYLVKTALNETIGGLR